MIQNIKLWQNLTISFDVMDNAKIEYIKNRVYEIRKIALMLDDNDDLMRNLEILIKAIENIDTNSEN